MANQSVVYFKLLALVAAVSCQSYPHLQLRQVVLANNSLLFRGDIGVGQNNSLHCITNNSDCCRNGEGDWYNRKGGKISSNSSKNTYVTRVDGVVYLNHNHGGGPGMWRCDIPDTSSDPQSIYIYLGTPTDGIMLQFQSFVPNLTNIKQVI